MQKLLLLLLPLAIVACTERDTVPANSAGSQALETYPQAPATAAPAAPATPGAAPSPATSPATLAPAQRTTLPGRGEGELESPAATDTVETRDEERNRAGSSDAAPIDPTRDSAIIDESGATGFGGRVMTPEALGDGELRLDDDDGTIEPDELPMLPADVIDAGPALIP